MSQLDDIQSSPDGETMDSFIGAERATGGDDVSQTLFILSQTFS